MGHHLVYNFFKSKEIKVSFGASGADELFGGYEAYKNINWTCDKIKNLSPYSNFKTRNLIKNQKFLKLLIYCGKKHLINIQNF